MYPAFGLCFGEYLQTVRDKKLMYNRIAIVSAAGLLGMSAGIRHLGWSPLDVFALAGDAYYIQHLPGTLWTLSVIGLQLFVCYRLSLILSEPLVKGAESVSRKLNTIYLVQWVIIPYTLAAMEFAGLPRLQPWAVVPAGLLIAAASIYLSRFIRFKL